MSKKLSLEERLSQAAKKSRRKSKKSHVSPAAATPTPNVENLPTGDQQPLESNPEVGSTPDAVESTVTEQQLKDTDVDQTNSTPDQAGLDKEEPEAPSPMKGSEELEAVLPLPKEPSNETEELEEPPKDQPRLKLQYIKYDWLPQSVWGNLEFDKALSLLDSHFGELLDLETSKVPPDTQNLLQSKDELIEQLRKEGEKLSKSEFKKSTKIKSLESELRDLQFASSSLQEDLEKRDNECVTLKKSLHNAQDQVSELNRTVVSLRKSVTDLDTLRRTIKEKDERINTLQVDLDNANRTLKIELSRFEAEKTELRSSTSSQISALESDLERLRIELERKSAYGNEDSDNDDRRNGTVLDTSGEQYLALKEQLEATERNLQMTRDSLNANISKLEETLESNKIEIEKLNKEIERVTTMNTLLQRDLDSQKAKNRYLTDELAREKHSSDSLKQSYQSLKDDYDLLEKKYNIQKLQLQANYEGNGAAVEATGPESLTDQWLPPLDDVKVSDLDFKELDSKSDLESSYVETPTNGAVEDEILGSSMPSIIVSAISNGSESHNSRSIRNQSRQTNLTNTETTQTNSQIITRLGSEIRRLENELKSMTDSYTKLSKEKDKANEEMLKLMNESDDLNAVKKENANFSKRIAELEHQLEVSLQLLGEKSETVEELENDVKDLKDMIRRQVQQIVELEERK